LVFSPSLQGGSTSLSPQPQKKGKISFNYSLRAITRSSVIHPFFLPACPPHNPPTHPLIAVKYLNRANQQVDDRMKASELKLKTHLIAITAPINRDVLFNETQFPLTMAHT
jgi:hypothetical protein